MRTTACAVVALLLLVCMMGAVSSVQALNQREVLMNVGTKHPAPLADAGVRIVHGLPRAGGAKNHLGAIDPSDDDSMDEVMKYALGLMVPIGICLGLALLTWASCWGFCCGRCCCDSCGRRTNDRTYSTKDQQWLKVGILLLGAVSVVLFALGLVSNASISSSLDDAYLKADRMVEHLYGIHAPLKSMSVAATDALAQVNAINKTLLAQLPPQTDDSAKECSTLMWQVVQDEQKLLSHLQPIVPSGSSGVAGGMNLTDLSVSMLSFRAKLDAMPNIGGDATELQNYASKINAALPSPMQSKSYLPSMHVASAQRIGLQSSSVSAQINTVLNNDLDNVEQVLPYFLPLLADLDASNEASPPSEQQSLMTHLSNDDRTAATVTEINNFNRSFSLLPPANDFFEVGVTSSYVLDVLRSAVGDAMTTIGQLADDIAAIGTGTDYDALLAKLQTLTSTSVTHNANLQSNLRANGAALDLLRGQTEDLYGAVKATEDGIVGMKYGSSSSNPASTSAAVLRVNASLPQLVCIKPVFNQLIKLNNTVLVLPDRLVQMLSRRQQMLVQLQRLLRIQSELNVTRSSALGAVAADLTNFPQISNVTSALADLSSKLEGLDAFAAANMIDQVDGAFASIVTSGSYLATLRAALPRFVANLTAISPSVTNARDLLVSLQSSLDTVPTSFSPWITQVFLSEIFGADFLVTLPQVVAQVNSASFASQGIEPGLRMDFEIQLSLYQYVSRAPSPADLRTNLTNVRSAAANLRSGQGTLLTDLQKLGVAAQQLPSVSRVESVTSLSYAATTEEPLAPFLAGTPLTDLDAAVDNFPSLDTSANSFAQAGQTLAANHGGGGSGGQQHPLAMLALDLSTSTNFMDEGDLAALYATLEATGRLASDFPDMATPLSSLSVASSGLYDAVTSLTDYRHKYYVARQDTVVFKNHIDWLRLLGFMLVLFVPIAVSMCGAYAWLKRYPLASLYMGMCSFSIAAIFFVMAAVQLLPSMLFVDQCSGPGGNDGNLDYFLRANFGRFGLSQNAIQPWVNLTAPVNATALFDWFHACEGPRPEIIDVFANPQAILEGNSINFTDYKVRVEANLAASNNTVQLKPSVWNHFVRLDADVQAVIAASLSAHGFLADCASAVATWQPFQESLCSSSGVAGAIALSTCLCFLFAVCMLPGVCLGVVGYKRFDNNMFGSNHLMEKAKFSGADDPYAAGLAEPARPAPLVAPGVAGGAGSPGRRVDSGEFEGLASPSLAVAPAPGSPRNNELQQQQQQQQQEAGNHVFDPTAGIELQERRVQRVASPSAALASPSHAAQVEGSPSPQPAADPGHHLVVQQPRGSVVHARGGSNVPQQPLIVTTPPKDTVYEYE